MALDSSKFTGLARFHTTRWSVVVRAQSPATAGADESLESLCRQYWPPLYAYVRGRGHPPHDAQDLTQQFFARLLEKNWLAPADRNQGKLRSFLLTAMKRFLANERDRTQAAQRGGLHAIASLDSEEGELKTSAVFARINRDATAPPPAVQSPANPLPKIAPGDYVVVLERHEIVNSSPVPVSAKSYHYTIKHDKTSHFAWEKTSPEGEYVRHLLTRK